VGAGAGAPGAAKALRAKAEATKRAILENISSGVKEGRAEEKAGDSCKTAMKDVFQ